MSRFSKIILAAAAAAFFVACTPSARIDGTVEVAPSSEVIVKLLDVNRYEVLDTVATDATGKFSYKVRVAEGQPEFVYIFYKENKIASLLLEAGDRVVVEADTLGRYKVAGSGESAKLAIVETDYSNTFSRLNDLAGKYSEAEGADAAAVKREMGKVFVDYYRSCVKYVMANSKSLTAIPVLYQNFGADLPVFGNTTDAIHFMNTADSLETVYPDSKYVKALRKEAARRYGFLEIQNRLNDAEEIGYPDIELPDIKARKVKLSEVESKVTMIYFWNPLDAQQKMMNLDVLKSLYEDYHRKGFEIYQVALAPDKTAWAQVVKQQNLPWINVCDGLGNNSPYVMTYNLEVLPAIYIIVDGALVDGGATDEKALRKLLDKHLK